MQIKSLCFWKVMNVFLNILEFFFFNLTFPDHQGPLLFPEIERPAVYKLSSFFSTYIKMRKQNDSYVLNKVNWFYLIIFFRVHETYFYMFWRQEIYVIFKQFIIFIIYSFQWNKQHFHNNLARPRKKTSWAAILTFFI